MVDVILCLNLKKFPNRLFACYGANQAHDMPFHMFRRWHAIPAGRYKTYEGIQKAMIAAGFPECAERVKDECKNMEPVFSNMHKRKCVYLQYLNYCQMLRYLIERDQTGIILYDDHYIKDFSLVQENYIALRKILPANDPIVMQLHHYEHEDELHRYRLEQPPIFHKDVPNLRKGMCTSSENAMLYSPEGAALVLDILFREFAFSVEGTVVDNIAEYIYHFSISTPVAQSLAGVGTHQGGYTNYQIPEVVL